MQSVLSLQSLYLISLTPYFPYELVKDESEINDS
jgi:hypothetical protein